MQSLVTRYNKEIVPKLLEESGIKSPMALPRLVKVVINVGTGRVAADASKTDFIEKELSMLAGQKPSIRRAKKSIAGFKLREGMPVGLAVTLRGKKMMQFLDRLVHIALPRVRDFKGLTAKGFDGKGNYSLGMKEHTVFPEIIFESSDKVFSLQVNISTTAKSDREVFKLLSALDFPFNEDAKNKFQEQ